MATLRLSESRQSTAQPASEEPGAGSEETNRISPAAMPLFSWKPGVATFVRSTVGLGVGCWRTTVGASSLQAAARSSAAAETSQRRIGLSICPALTLGQRHGALVPMGRHSWLTYLGCQR